MIRDAMTCDRRGCLAVYIEPADLPDDADAFERAAWAAGWTRTGTGHRCPACTQARPGRHPVYERGECPRCMGRTYDAPTGAQCLYCGHTTPHSDEWD